MQKQLEKIEAELVKRIHDLYIEKYNGNKTAFANASGCKETTIRRILRNQQGITINLLLRLANALDTPIDVLLEGLSIKKES